MAARGDGGEEDSDRDATAAPGREDPSAAAAAPSPGRAPSPATEAAARADRHVGARVRERRLALGLTLQAVAARLGITFQQLRKYETGEDRLSAGRLYAVALALSAPAGWFFEGLPPALPFADPVGADEADAADAASAPEAATGAGPPSPETPRGGEGSGGDP